MNSNKTGTKIKIASFSRLCRVVDIPFWRSVWLVISTPSLIFTLSLVFISIFFTGCQKKTVNNFGEKIIIWTDNAEFVQYTELFNKTHKDNSAVLVYKENPALSLPPAKDEVAPDIVVGSWLRTDSSIQNFISLDYLFDSRLLTSDIFYENLLESGKVKNVQYLLPVSFNLPAIIFSEDNADLVSDSYTLSLEQIRQLGSSFNEKKKNGTFSKMGFTPLNNSDFLYLTAKVFGADFRDQAGTYVWNETRLSQTVDFLRDWVTKENESAQTEEDFAYKYLFMPYYRQVTSGRTLFAYTSSDQLFKVLKDQNINIDYRWIAKDKSILMEDNFTMAGIFKGGRNKVGATEFLTWFFDAENQEQILDRKEKMHLENEIFGIAGGFSSVRDVTEHILPVYYTRLLTNLPPAQMLTVPQKLPARWTSYQNSVLENYLREAVTAENLSDIPSVADLEAEWRKKVFD